MVAGEPGSGDEIVESHGFPGTKRPGRSLPVKCSNLERGESMKDPVSIFGCWRGFSVSGALGSTREQAPGRFKLPIAALLARIRRLIPKRNDHHYDEIVRGFGVGALRTPATPMSDQELSKAIADFLRDAPSAEAVSNLGRRFDPSSGV